MKRFFTFLIMVSTLICTAQLSTGRPTESSPKPPDAGIATPEQNRLVLPMDFGWKFKLGDANDAQIPDFDDSNWRQVDLPHDWSIEGPFDQNAPTGGFGGSLPTGIGWYRTHFKLPDSTRNRRVWIEFDGIYQNSTVWLNGHCLGKRPFGYIGFHYDLTDYLTDERENVLAVRVDNSQQPNTRWYSGSGIYRHVRLIIPNPIHIGYQGVYITTPQVSDKSATVVASIRIENEDTVPVNGTLRSILVDPNGREAAKVISKFKLKAGKQTELKQQMEVASPNLWSVQTPALYTLMTVVLGDKKFLDEVDTTVGIRNIEYNVDRGFLLNGKQVKMNGVCLHHDGGCVGAAVPESVWERRLKILKEMGCNAIRTAHNPPAPEFLDLCDRLGFLVMDESFDEWQGGKVKYGYSKYFDEWSQRDLVAMLHRDRNHPSVVMWSVGNEVGEQHDPNGYKIMQRLADICHREDPTRPVTQGCDKIAADDGDATPEFMKAMDVAGYNYVDRWHQRRELYYSIDREKNPNRKFVGTESASMWSVRGQYNFGEVNTPWFRQNYNTVMIRAEQLWKFVALHDYVIGDFMWTGIDYLGESWWPSKNASSGVIDLCGFPKDSYFFYQSQWTEKPMIHLFPHWNWKGKEGQIIPALAYTNCDTVELFLNDKSLGKKSLEFPRQGNSKTWMGYDKPPVNATTADLHLSWDVPYEPGVLKAVGKKNGQIVCTQEVRTAGAPAAIRLSVDREVIAVETRDAAHVTVEIVDSAGVIVPIADNLVHFTVEGQGRLIGVDNGNPIDHDSFKDTKRKAFNGLCLAIVQSARRPGNIRLTARADGLKEASVEIKVLRKNQD